MRTTHLYELSESPRSTRSNTRSMFGRMTCRAVPVEAERKDVKEVRAGTAESYSTRQTLIQFSTETITNIASALQTLTLWRVHPTCMRTCSAASALACSRVKTLTEEGKSLRVGAARSEFYEAHSALRERPNVSEGRGLQAQTNQQSEMPLFATI